MICECGGATMIKDSRKIDVGVWRKRVCTVCALDFTTLEQRCETVAHPHSTKRHAKPTVVAPKVPAVDRPPVNRPDPGAPPKPRGRKPLLTPKPVPAEPKMRRGVAPVILPQLDKTYPKPKVVDRLTPSARDRIEDMKAERKTSDYGWD